MDIIVRDKQNIFDIALQYFGDLSFVSTIINDNILPWSAPLTQGQTLIINNQGVGNDEVKNFFAQNRAFVQNGAVIIANNEPPHTFDSTIITWDSTVLTWDSTQT